MQLGAIFPQLEIESDVDALRAFALGVEDLGYAHIAAFDHVLGADDEVHENWSGRYDVESTFQEPLVLFGFFAAICSLELTTSIVILPQRQTALVAKQAAQVDILTRGRFRFGVGVGWNPVEYEALGQDFSQRGSRQEEQIELLRRLWTEASVTFDGRFDKITGAGLAPLPIQQPIPIWIGGWSPVTYRRIGRLADGWFPRVDPGPQLDHALSMIVESATAAGRDPDSIGMEGRVTWGSCGLEQGLEQVVDQAEQWRQAGATYLSIDTMRAGFTNVDGHLEALARFKAALG